MIQLKESFRKKGVNFTQKYRDDRVVIYRLDRDYVNGTHGHWYEVFRITIKPAGEFITEDYEKYPGDECFGLWAWSCSNLDVVRKVLDREFGMSLPECDF